MNVRVRRLGQYSQLIESHPAMAICDCNRNITVYARDSIAFVHNNKVVA